MPQGFLVLAQLGGGSGLVSLLPMVAIFVIMWFLIILPQQRQAKQHRSLLDTLKKGDEVLTQGGMIGKIHALTDRTVTLEISGGVRVKVLKSSIQQLWKTEDDAGKPDEKSSKTEEEKK